MSHIKRGTGDAGVTGYRCYRYRCGTGGTGVTTGASPPHLADAPLHGAGGGDAGVRALCLDAGRGEAAVRVPPARHPRPVTAGHRRHLRIEVDIYIDI